MRKRRDMILYRGILFISALFLVVSCSRKNAETNEGAPPAPVVVHETNNALISVDHPEKYSIVTAAEVDAAPTLNATGVVSPDVSRQVPVVSLASGRVVRLAVKLGDTVKKGQFLMQLRSSDIGSAFSDYRKAVTDEKLARIQYERAKRLHDAGVIALNDLQVAEDTKEKANVDLETTRYRLKTLGADPKHPTTLVNIDAPVSGVITDEQVTLSSGVQAFASPNPFTISDLSHLWILCDVYENDLAFIALGQFADVRLNAYPDNVWKARIINISPILDPNLRTAKVRLELNNPGFMRIGMFATATFYGKSIERHAVVPATAILHLHDRDWVYVPAGGGAFKRVEVTHGAMIGERGQEILSGITPGEKVVEKALLFDGNIKEP